MYTTGLAAGHKDLINIINNFLTMTGSASGLRFSGLGNGRLGNLTGGANSVAETYTVMATSPTTFSVTGSVSGPVGEATVDNWFITDSVSFFISQGSAPFEPGDTFIFVTAPRWTAVRSIADSEYIWKAPGADGLSAIYVGAKVYENGGSDIYNLQLNGFSGYDAGAAFDKQPGAVPTVQGLGLWRGAIPYWLVANGRRVVIVAKVTTVYQAGYLGLIEQYIDPLVFPYPLAVGGSITGNIRFSDSSDANRCFPIAGTSSANSQLKLRMPTGEWRGFTAVTASGSLNGSATPAIWPYQSGMAGLRPNVDGSQPLLPITLFEPTQLHGRLDGVMATTGFGTGSESELDDGVVKQLVVQNVFRTATDQYFTVKLD